MHGESRSAGIMFIDADHLKYINDTFGHDMGNLAISSIAAVIRQHCPDNSVSMRYGGDEFVCVIPDYDQTQMQKLKQNSSGFPCRAFQKQPYGNSLSRQASGLWLQMILFSHSNDYINLADEKCTLTKKIVKPDGKIHIRLPFSDGHSLVTVVFEIFFVEFHNTGVVFFLVSVRI